ncbi:tRNA pseudouridine(55) synthase [hydrothermal vent metagenome]|uniref:tRNA pseudouridine(55) synthase n=1 Tax=hydrothermal vent metagenome TaxID=652676 RepID=A0A3B1A6C5_9ZZZZ
MARKRKGRAVHGIILLDKSSGISSNAALQQVKRLFNAQKAGHTGSLDPLATGLLPICLGEATKITSYLLDADKKYQGMAKLGIRTNTADAEGDVLQTRPVPILSDNTIEMALDSFRGEISQIPPMYSALKLNGKPLYELARQGIEVERKPRNITIFELKKLGFDNDELALFVHCSKGTYIRTLVEDLGEILECGAHLKSLRRVAAGPFDINQTVSLDKLTALAEEGVDALDALLIPMHTALADWPEISLSDNSAYYVRQGQPVLVPKAPSNGWVRLMGEKPDDFIGIGHILEDGRVAPKRLVNL